MMSRRTLAVLVLQGLLWSARAQAQTTLGEQNQSLLLELQQVHGLSDAQMSRIRSIFAGSRVIGQGNPAITRHPMTPEQCRARAQESGASYTNPTFERICGAKFMAPLYDPSHESPESSKACIDQFEFPDIPCEFPVVWVKAKEAAELCEADREGVERERERLAVEVAGRQHHPVVGKQQGIVGDAVDLPRDDRPREADRLTRGAVNLRHAAQAVGVLDARAVAV